MSKAWKIAPGSGAHAWPECLEGGCILFGWRELGDHARFKSVKAVEKAMQQKYEPGEEGTGPRAALSVWRFAKEVQPKDVVVANNGRGSVVGVGVIKSDYLAPASGEVPIQHQHLRSARLVDWVISEPVQLPKWFFLQDTVWPLEPEQCEIIKWAFLKKKPSLKVKLDRLFDSVSSHRDVDDSGTKNLLDETETKLAEQQPAEKDPFNPTSIKDGRERVIASIVRRRGQPTFRKQLLAAYNGRCAITGCDVEAILEAAHIVPYKGSKTNHPGNGLLLRADIHTLFDLRLIAVDHANLALLVSPKLEGSEYAKYRGKSIRVPDDPNLRPSPKALEHHRRKSQLQ